MIALPWGRSEQHPDQPGVHVCAGDLKEFKQAANRRTNRSEHWFADFRSRGQRRLLVYLDHHAFR